MTQSLLSLSEHTQTRHLPSSAGAYLFVRLLRPEDGMFSQSVLFFWRLERAGTLVNFRRVCLAATAHVPPPPELATLPFHLHPCAAKTGLAAEPTGSLIRVPPLPSLERLKFAAEYWPSSVRLAVWAPSVTVSVPLVLLAASVNFTVVAEVKTMSRRSIASFTPAGEAKPAIVPENVWEA
jgi:hypothetical protein